MMKKSLIISLVVLAGCSVQSETTNKTTSIEFNYKVENGGLIGLVQTFEMAGNTTLQFRDIDSKNLEFIDSNSKKIPFKIVGQYAVLTGVHTDFLAVVNSAAAQITRKAAAVASVRPLPTGQNAEPPKATEVDIAKIAPESLPSDQYLKLEIARMQNELSEIRKLLAAASAKPIPATPMPSSPYAQYAQEVQPTKSGDLVIVNFRDNSTEFEITAKNKPILINRARQASHISVKGYTDSNVANRVADNIAKNRANAAKIFLVKNGISESKITMAHEASGNFISNNSTKAGKEANRRVEIALL